MQAYIYQHYNVHIHNKTLKNDNFQTQNKPKVRF